MAVVPKEERKTTLVPKGAEAPAEPEGNEETPEETPEETTESPKDEAAGEETGDEKPKGDEKPELTPEQLKAELTRTRAEAANWRTKLRDAEKKLGEAKTAEEYEAAVTELRAELAAKDHEILRGNVARKHGLPDELAVRLQGEDEAALEKDALELKKFATAAAPPAPVRLRGGLDPNTDPDDTNDPRELARRHGGRRR